MKTVYALFDKLLKIISVLLSFVLIAIVIIICLQTFCRYILFHSLSWSEELTRYLFVFVVSCGLGIGITKDALIRINIIDGILGDKGMKFMQVLYDIAGVVVCTVLCKYNLQLIKTGMTRMTSALAPIRFGHIYIVMEVSFFIALFAAVLKTTKSVTNFIYAIKGKGGVET